MDSADVSGMAAKMALETPDTQKPCLLMVANELESFFNHRLPQARAARDSGYEVHVAMREATEAKIRDRDGLVFHTLPLSRGFSSPLQEFRALSCLNQLASRLRPQVIHAYTLKPTLYAGLVSRHRNIPLAASITGVGSFFLGTTRRDKLIQQLLTRALRFALAGDRPRMAIVQNSDDESLATQSFGVALKDVTRIKGSGVDLSTFTPPSEIAPPPIKVVLAARMLADKGINEFVGAARMLKERGVEAEFILAGTPDPANRSSIAPAQLAAWTNQGIVKWLGNVEDMAALYASAHIACLPSYREGLPKALLEAASSGLAIVTTDVPGCRDAIIDGKTGTLVPVQNITDLANALEQLIANERVRISYGVAGREFIANGFSVETVTRQTLDVYLHLLSNKR